MFPSRIGPSAKHRALALLGALALHAAVLALAQQLIEGARPRALASAVRDGLVRVVLWPLQARRQATFALPVSAVHRPPRAPPPGAVPWTEELVVEGSPDAELVVPNAPAVVIDMGSAQRAEPATGPAPGRAGEGGPGLAEERGDSARRGPRRLLGDRWHVYGVAGASTTPPTPSEYCVPRAPGMPEEARLRGLEGRVEAVYEVTADGIVAQVAVQGEAESVLADAVRRWLRGCLFEPSLQDGRRTAARVRQSFRFQLK